MRPPESAQGEGGAAASRSPLAVDARGVSLTFQTRDGEVQALSNVDLQIGTGDFVSFIGPSGCGKTTLLRVIADLERPTAGTILVNGVTPEQARLQPPLRLYLPGAGALSVADDRAQRRVAAGDHGLRRRERRRARRTLSETRQSRRLRAQISLAAVRRHAAARIDRARAIVRSGAVADGRAVRRARRDRARPPQRAIAAAVGPDPERRSCSSPIRSPRRCFCRPRSW